jgi:hypothetical protein
MRIDYMECIGERFPNVFASCFGDPSVYSNIAWESGEPLPSRIILDSEILDMKRIRKWDEIQAYRDSLKIGGVMVADNWFHSDPDSRIQYLGMRSQARDMILSGKSLDDPIQKLGFNVMWKPMATDVRVLITAGVAIELVDKVGDLDAMVFEVAVQHKATMMALPDPTSYDFSQGWPEVYAVPPL